MSRRALLAGAVVALTFGWPAGEGLSALTWPAKVFDSVGPDEAAARRLLRSAEGPLGESLPRRDEPSAAPDCLDGLEMRSQLPAVGLDDLYVASALRILADREGAGDVDAVAIGALRSLPHPALGALDGCVSGSLLAPLCRAYVSRRVRAALASASPRLAQQRAGHMAEARRLACHVLARPAQPTK